VRDTPVRVECVNEEEMIAIGRKLINMAFFLNIYPRLAPTDSLALPARRLRDLVCGQTPVQLAKRGETSRLAKVIGDIYKVADNKLLHTDPNTSHHDSGGATCVLVLRECGL
jgi:hypothetical protein